MAIIYLRVPDECQVVDVEPHQHHQMNAVLRNLDDQADDQLAAVAYSHVIVDEPFKSSAEHSATVLAAASAAGFSCWHVEQLLLMNCWCIVVFISMLLISAT